MAASEAISKLTLHRIGHTSATSLIDVRYTRLPHDRPPVTDFDPRDYRSPRSPISQKMAYFNLIRTVFGAGMLGMPLAISQAGMALGPVLTLACGVLLIHTHLTLILDWRGSQLVPFLCLYFPYLIMEIAMKSLKRISYVSMFGNFMNLIGLLLVFYHIFASPHGEYIWFAHTAWPILYSFGSNLFNMSAVAVILSLDKVLKDPKVMTKTFGVLSIGITIPTFVSMIFGCLGYWSFGTMEENILRSLPFSENSAMVAVALYLIAVALAYPIQCYAATTVFIEVIKNHDPKSMPADSTLKLVEHTCRPIFVSLTFLIAYCVPFQGPFVGFVGNLCTSQLALVFPAMMEICLLYPNNYGKYNYYLFKDLLIILLGLVSFIFGAYFCVYIIYIRLKSGSQKGDDIYL